MKDLVTFEEMVIRVRVDSAFDAEDARKTISFYQAAPWYRVGLPVLWDLRDMLSPLAGDRWTAPVMQDLKEFVELSIPAGKHRYAMLAEDPLVFGLAKMYEIHGATNQVTYRAFKAEAKALHWVMAEPTP